MKKMISIVASIIALTVMAPGHAEETTRHTVVEQVTQQAQDRLDAVVMMLTEPVISFSNYTTKDYECLAKNIFYEAANEPEEGKVAVGVVTLNRASNDKFPQTICEVVNQKTSLNKVRNVTKKVKTILGTKEQTTQVTEKVTVCQFSWRCIFVKTPKADDMRWEESKHIAKELLDGGYLSYRIKYRNAMYFHATYVRPSWAVQKHRVNKIGGHIFYADK
jgi:spore germination cell wall hydrolase CwlJ-like protein